MAVMAARPWATLRWLIPLAMLGVALAGGAVVVAVTFAVLEQTLRGNAEQESSRLVHTLSLALVEPVLRRDVWQVYQLVRAASTASPDASGEVVVIDEDDRVLAASQPLRLPVGSHVSALPRDWQALVRAAQEGQSPRTSTTTADRASPALITAAAIRSEEGTVIGVVLAAHALGLSARQQMLLLQQLGLIGVATLLIVALGGAALGRRLVQPIGSLRDSMARVEAEGLSAPGADHADVPDVLLQRRDEVGDLARAYVAMLRQIGHQRLLERQVLEAERLARVGQIAATLAHEVNNPIGGLLAALDNRRLRGGIDAQSERTLDVIERGLRHIAQTVSAVLNEARAGHHALQADDLRDLRVLLEPFAQRSGITLDWRVIRPAAELPAVPVRQVLLNLSINAIHAAGFGGKVALWSQETDTAWRVSVANSGQALSAADFDALVGGRQWQTDVRVGLGLWVSARLVADIGGQLRWVAQAPWATVIEVVFPLVPIAPAVE
jgi:signal transduction histidine kinase